MNDDDFRHLCVKSKSESEPRKLRLRPEEEHQIIQTIRKQQDTDEWKERYNTCAGIEGTLSQGIKDRLPCNRWQGSESLPSITWYEQEIERRQAQIQNLQENNSALASQAALTFVQDVVDFEIIRARILF